MSSHPSRHRLSRRSVLGLAAAATLGPLAAACSTRSDPNELVVWTPLTDTVSFPAQQAIVANFEKAHPGVHVTLAKKPSQGTGDATSIITAVRSGTAPDVYIADRFTVAQYAGIGLLESIQPFVNAAGGPEFTGKYLGYAMTEATYNGQAYGLPFDTDDRALFYNKTLLRNAGVDIDLLDPKNGPISVDELVPMAAKANKQDAHGNYTVIGFIPWSGQGFYATWALGFGAKYFDNASCAVTLTEPAFRQTFEDFRAWSRALDYNKVTAFTATYQPPNAPPSQTPFLTNHLAMAIDGNFGLPSLRKYAKDLDYGVTYLPVAKKGDKPFTWAGGFAATVPKGAKNPKLAFEFMTYLTGEAGQRLYTKETAHLPTWKSLLDDAELISDQKFFADILQYARSRPPLPVGAQLDDAMNTASQAVLLGDSTPAQALQIAQTRIQDQMKDFCSYTIAAS